MRQIGFALCFLGLGIFTQLALYLQSRAYDDYDVHPVTAAKNFTFGWPYQLHYPLGNDHYPEETTAGFFVMLGINVLVVGGLGLFIFWLLRHLERRKRVAHTW